MEDAREILRMDGRQVSEYAIRLKDFRNLTVFNKKLDNLLAKELNKQEKPIFELHSWEKLSPFFNIARMIDIMTFFIKLMLIAIVLISIMNVMIMAVYERIREIGTIAAIGTLPGKILNMFVIEGFCMGVAGAAIGDLVGISLVYILNLFKISYDFGQQKGLLLQASVQPADVFIISITVIIVSVIASLQPALRASRMEPIKALRHV
jgi:putative ABC transport system permease protein